MSVAAAEVILHDSLAVMASAENPFTRRRKLQLGDLMDEPWAIYPSDSFFGALIAETFRRNGCEPPRPTVASLSFQMHMELLATGRFLTVLPGFMLTIPGRHPPLNRLAVTLQNAKMLVGVITLKNRTLTPSAALPIDAVRIGAKALATPKP